MISTRSQVRKVRQKALADRNNDNVCEVEIAVTTPSDTGEGTHIRWQHLKVSQDIHEMLSGLKLKESRDSEGFLSAELQRPQDELPKAATSWFPPEKDRYSTPNSSRPATPSAPKRPTCRPPTPITPIKAKSKAKPLFEGGGEKHCTSSEEAPRKSSDVELERRIRDRENKKRVYKLITTSRPDLLREAKRDPLRVDLRENMDPFL